MNWTLVALLSSAGLVIGIATIFGVDPAAIGWLWIAAACITSVVLGVREPTRGFRHGFAVGFFGGVVTPLLQAVFFSQYVAHYPGAANQLQGLPLGLGPAAFLVVLSPVAGLINGVTLGVMSWLAGKIRIRVKNQPAAA